VSGDAAISSPNEFSLLDLKRTLVGCPVALRGQQSEAVRFPQFDIKRLTMSHNDASLLRRRTHYSAAKSARQLRPGATDAGPRAFGAMGTGRDGVPRRSRRIALAIGLGRCRHTE
jgi:hypothetical protein